MGNSVQTQVSGTVNVRPLLLGVALDVSQAEEVAGALRTLAKAWGGCFSAALSASLSPSELAHRLRWFGLDALALWTENDKLSELLQDRQLLWRGSGDWGPFGTGRYSHGLLPWSSLQGAPSNVAGDHDPLLDWFDKNPPGPTHLVALADVPASILTHAASHSPPVIVLVDRASPTHRVQVWNMRAVGTRLAVVDDESGKQSVDWEEVVSWCRASGAEDSADAREIWVWDLRESEGETPDLDALREAFNTCGVSWFLHTGDRHPALYTRILRTDTKSTFTATAPYGAMRPSVSIPTVPLSDDGATLGEYRTVAAEVMINSVSGHDPRLVARLPDDSRFSDLLNFVSDDVVRVRRPTEWGFVAGVSATTTSLNIQLHRKSEVFRRLLGAEQVVVEQSDVGLFQTRAGEMLGGAAGGALTQAGMAAAFRLLVSHPSGVPLARLKSEILNNRGAWPGKFAQASPAEYAEGVLRGLVGSGMVRASLKAKCSYCRANLQLEPEDMRTLLNCDFCGQETRFALMVGWGSPKWVFRLAGHLSEAQVQAMIPALATLGQLSHLTGLQGGVDCSELGLTVTAEGRSAEVDVAAYLTSPIPVTVLGEVKSRNRIDARDASNLEWLQDKLSANQFDSLLLFATTKDQLGPEEIEVLRRHCEDRAIRLEIRRVLTPRLPLVLTGRDLFLPWLHDDNIGRWARDSPALAIHGTAIESCRRNLGLEAWHFEGQKVRLTWST